MDAHSRRRRIAPAWSAIAMFGFIVTSVAVCSALFAGTFRPYEAVTLTSDRSGLVLESGAKVRMRGVEVGRVGHLSAGRGPVRLELQIDPAQMEHIPANVQAEIKATTAFGAKYVELVAPPAPSPHRLAAGAVLQSTNVSTEVNTVFENLVGVLQRIDVAKLNATLTAFADGVRGQGDRIGAATSAANEVLLTLDPRMEQLAGNWRSLTGLTETYSAAAPALLDLLDTASTTAVTVTGHAADLDALLLNTIGFADAGINLLAPNTGTLVRAVDTAEPTTDLLMKYNPVYTCLLLGGKWFLDNGGYDTIGGNGRSVVIDAAFLLGDDPYRYPQNLPVVAAKGGPDGRPGCGSLPDATKNFPVRQLVANTGFGTGLDWRPNPGIGFPGWANYFPVTKAVPEPPRIRYPGGPAPGPPPPYPGAPPYGAPPP
ncbi:MCE family protein [Mycolicibacterium sp.]|uniref:MCE family protein n=1 Tax=Mycolicibacterium sp. TaxID=2320850 RepID=UPI003D0A632F